MKRRLGKQEGEEEAQKRGGKHGKEEKNTTAFWRKQFSACPLEIWASSQVPVYHTNSSPRPCWETNNVSRHLAHILKQARPSLLETHLFKNHALKFLRTYKQFLENMYFEIKFKKVNPKKQNYDFFLFFKCLFVLSGEWLFYYIYILSTAYSHEDCDSVST